VAARVAEEEIGFEAKAGTIWTLRIGLGLLAIAAAYFARAIVRPLAPVWKVVLAYASAAVLFSVGKVYERRLAGFARPVMAGGLALGFFVSYAAYFVTPMRAVSLPISLAWMTIGVATILLFAERWRSQPMAALAIVLGHISAFVAAGSADSFSLIIITMLSILAVVLLIRHDWVELTLFAVVTAYGSHMLWSLADHALVTAERAFWVNVAFIASYYVAFLVADLVWWRRVTGGAERESRHFQELTGRLVGPINVTLFFSVVAYLYVATDVYVTDIHWFFFVLAVVQGAHGRYLRALGNEDYVFYPAVGAILVTLGFFSAFEALSLNLVLAVEALVLLFLAHRTRVWLFHPLAQATLALNFVHSWIYAENVVATVPVLLGTVAVVAVYMVQSWLEDQWYDREGGPDWEIPGASAQLPLQSISKLLAERFDDIYSKVTPYLSFVHAGAGALILIHHSEKFLAVPHALGVLSGALLLLLAVALVVRSVPFLVGYLVLQCGVVYIAYQGSHGSNWVSWSAVTAGFFGALVLASAGPPRVREASDRKTVILLSHGVIWGALVAMPAAFIQSSWGGPLNLFWIATLALLFFQQERISSVVKTLENGGDEFELYEKLSGGLACVWGGILVIMWTSRIGSATGVVPDFAVPALSVLWGGVLIAAAGFRNDLRIFLGGATVFLVCYFVIPREYPRLIDSVLATIWVVAMMLGVAVALDLRLDRESPTTGLRRPAQVATYAAYGLGFLLLFAFLENRFGFPWSVVAMSVLPFALISLASRFGAEQATWVAFLTLLFLQLCESVGLFTGLASAPSALLLPALLFLTQAVVFERVLCTRHGLPVVGEEGDPNPVARLLLIIGTAAVAMVVIYESAILVGAWVTACWSMVGAVLMILGFLWKSASYRRVALVALAVCLARVFLVDVRNLSDEAKVLAFAALGVCLLAVAWLYSRFAGDIKKWL